MASSKRTMNMTVTCPDWPSPDVAPESQIIGCGRTYDAEPDCEGLVDCPECGICFNAERAARERPSEPHQVSEGGTPEDAAYWERRNALQPRVAR
jgi:hypothetical protein